jgi:hypothetical protein
VPKPSPVLRPPYPTEVKGLTSLLIRVMLRRLSEKVITNAHFPMRLPITSYAPREGAFVLDSEVASCSRSSNSKFVDIPLLEKELLCARAFM